ncbi:MAG: hypothetical protein RL681_308 [Candidatus Parcubacteria bacterium]|jgi:pimeloyl-ACP methyl ester carboxylesterase
MHPYRTRFKKEIVAEFYPPLTRKKPKEDKVIIFCPGLHGGPSSSSLLEPYAKKGFWAIKFRYRGTWESGGRFLRSPHEKDVLDIIEQLPHGFVTIPDHKRFVVRPKAVYVFGVSFGGAAAILASRDERVTKAVALSAVVDWRDQAQRAHSLEWSRRFTREAFGEAYRFSDKDWRKLNNGTFYNPIAIAHMNEIDGKKLLIIHAKDDDVVRFGPVAKFAKMTGATLISLKRGGHGSSSWFTKPRIYKKIAKFLKSS